MPQFRKKPEKVVQAEQWFKGLDIDGVVQPNPNSMTQFEPHVITPQGLITVKSGDWIVKGEKGTEVYKPDIFKQSYEPVGDEAIAAWKQAYEGWE